MDDLFAFERDLDEVLEEVGRLGVRLLIQTAIEAGVTQVLVCVRSATPTAGGPDPAAATTPLR